MAELTVKFKTSGFSSAARSLGRSFDSRYNDYQGIRKKVLEVPTSRNYLGTSGSYLQKKMDSLDSKRDKLDGFKRKVEDFCAEAKQADKGVANRIKSDAKSFYKTQGIKTGFVAAVASFFKKAGKAICNGLNDVWSNIKDAAKTIREVVKDFYQKHKKLIDKILTVVGIVVAVVVIVAAIAATVLTAGAGTPALVAALIAIGKVVIVVGSAKATYDVITGGTAWVLSKFGLQKGADFFTAIKSNNLLKKAGEGVDLFLGNEDGFFGNYLQKGGIVLDVATAASGILKLTKTLTKVFKLDRLKTLTRWDWRKHFTGGNTFEAFKKVIKWDVVKQTDVMRYTMSNKIQYKVFRAIFKVKDLTATRNVLESFQTIKNVKNVIQSAYNVYNDGWKKIPGISKWTSYTDKLRSLFDIRPVQPTPIKVNP